MTGESVLELLDRLRGAGVEAWIDGGWGVTETDGDGAVPHPFSIFSPSMVPPTSEISWNSARPEVNPPLFTSKFHGDYDQALGRFGASMAKSMSAAANNRWREQQGLDVDPANADGIRIGGSGHVAAGRPGHTDAKARLEDLDQDGIAASVLYSEVSAFNHAFLRLVGQSPRDYRRTSLTSLSR